MKPRSTAYELRLAEKARYNARYAVRKANDAMQRAEERYKTAWHVHNAVRK